MPRSEQTPITLPEDLRLLDEQLWGAASSSRVPSGMADRVFQASVEHLPGRRVTRPMLRLAGTRANRRVASWRSRLAMAASLGMAFVATALFLSVPGGVQPEMATVAVQANADVSDPSGDSIDDCFALLASLDSDTLDAEAYLDVMRSDLTDFANEADQLTDRLADM